MDICFGIYYCPKNRLLLMRLISTAFFVHYYMQVGNGMEWNGICIFNMRRLTQFIFRTPGLRLGNFQMEILETSEKSRLTPTSTACGSSHPERIASSTGRFVKANPAFS